MLDVVTYLEVLEQAAELHELRHDVDRLLRGADRVELDELGVPQLLHDVGLREEVLGVHGAGLEGLYGHGGRVVPQSLPHLPELAVTQLPQEL